MVCHTKTRKRRRLTQQLAGHAVVFLTTFAIGANSSQALASGNVPLLMRTTQTVSIPDIDAADASTMDINVAGNAASIFELPPLPDQLLPRQLATKAPRNSAGVHPLGKQVRSRSSDDSLRGLLGVAPVNPSGIKGQGQTRTNRYFDLQQDGTSRSAGTQGNPFANSKLPAENSSGFSGSSVGPLHGIATHTVTAAKGSVKTNPLVLGTPPKLQQFRAADLRPADLRPGTLPNTDAEVVDGLRLVRKPTLAMRQIQDVDQVIEALETTPGTYPSARSFASESGFGMLAMDEIGSHLPDEAASLGKALPSQPVLSALPVVDLKKPLPKADSQPAEMASATIKVAPSIKSETDLPSPFQPNATGLKPMEVDDLIRQAQLQPSKASSKTSTQDEKVESEVEAKISFADRLSTFGKKLNLGGRTSKPKPVKATNRSGGILSHWLKSRP